MWVGATINQKISVADPGSGAFLAPGAGMGKKSRYVSGMNNPDHIYESLWTIFGVTILKFFDVDPGSGIFLTLDPGWKKFWPIKQKITRWWLHAALFTGIYFRFLMHCILEGCSVSVVEDILFTYTTISFFGWIASAAEKFSTKFC